jgi:hypothetical protein
MHLMQLPRVVVSHGGARVGAGCRLLDVPQWERVDPEPCYGHSAAGGPIQPAIRFSTVDYPLPDRPITATDSPCVTSRTTLIQGGSSAAAVAVGHLGDQHQGFPGGPPALAGTRTCLVGQELIPHVGRRACGAGCPRCRGTPRPMMGSVTMAMVGGRRFVQPGHRADHDDVSGDRPSRALAMHDDMHAVADAADCPGDLAADLAEAVVVTVTAHRRVYRTRLVPGTRSSTPDAAAARGGTGLCRPRNGQPPAGQGVRHRGRLNRGSLRRRIYTARHRHSAAARRPRATAKVESSAL